jgi:flagellar biosynthesis protein FlhF
MKSYFANSFRVAMEQARKELGPDAMLVTTRTAALEARHLGEYEVVFAADLPPAPQSAPAPPKETPTLPPLPSPFTTPTFPQLTTPAAPAAATDVSAMLAEILQQLTSSRLANSSLPAAPPAAAPPSHTKNLLNELVRREVSPEIAQRLVSAAENRLRASSHDRGARPHLEVPLDPVRLRAALLEEIREAVPVDSRLTTHFTTGAPILLALVGPPGVGKTAAIAKLAVRQGLTARKPAVLISLDTLRVGASEQLRCYASLLGLAFQVAETNRALEQSLEEHRNKELILIDTPGFALSDLNGACDCAEFLARRTDIEKLLVLPASMRSADIARMSAAYQAFKPSRSIFTRMDETESFGAVLNETVTSGRPIAFFCAGQRVPEDLTEATSQDLASLLLPSPETSSCQPPVSTQALAEPARPVDTLQNAA